MLSGLLNGGGSDANMVRMEINSYKMIDLSGDKVGTFKLQTNPENISYSFGVEDDRESGDTKGGDLTPPIGAAAPPTAFKGFQKMGLTFKFYADATGIIPIPEEIKGEFDNGGKPSIRKHLQNLKDTVFSYQAESHGPPFLEFIWGEVFLNTSSKPGEEAAVFKATLKKCDIKILLFSLSGEPVRAEITLEVESATAAVAHPPKNSPDVTHNIDIQYGSKMTTICKGIYGRYDSKICAAIAEYNGLVNCDLNNQTGKKLVFPSIHLLNDEYLDEWDKLEKEQKKAEAEKVLTHYEHKVDLIGKKRANQYFKTMGLDKEEPYAVWRARRNRNKGYEA